MKRVLRGIQLSIFSIILTGSIYTAQAQSSYTISGYITDSLTGEFLLGANLYVADDQGKGVASNTYGFYSLTLPEGQYDLVSSYLGYNSYEFSINLNRDIEKNIPLQAISIISDEVVITDEREDENVETTEMSRVDLEIEEIKKLPALLGEVDIIKTLQLLPGIQASGEGNAGLFVRGGGPDQNLILLDEAVVYNTGHLFGFFSVFNPDAIKNVSMMKGGVPSKYGGRISSVLDITMKEGNNQEFTLDGGIGLIASRLTVQGPIVRDKSSFILSGRRTYALDLAQPAIDNTDFAGTNYFFYDVNAKVNYIFDNKNRIFASGYFGRDVFKFNNNERNFNIDIPWGNTTATVRWNHLFNDQLFLNTSLIYNDYNFDFTGGQDDFNFKIFSGIEDFSAKVDLDYYPSVNHRLGFGGQYAYHAFTPSTASGSSGETVFEPTIEKKYANDASVYIQDEWDINKRWKIHYGLRGSWFQQRGPYELIRDQNGEMDTISFAKGEPVKDYYGLEPRINARYKIDSESSIKSSINFTNQYIHLVSNSSSTLPTDIWVPSTESVKPQKGIQYTVGYFKNFEENMYETSLELYYKDLKNQIDYREGYVYEINTELDREFVYGEGASYGAELFVRKNKGPFTGWIGYTLSKTTRTFEDLNDGNQFPAKFDRTHDLSIVGNYRVNDKWNLGAVFVYGTGNAITLPVGVYLVEQFVANEYGERNQYRVKSYHRFDLSATLTPKPWKTDGLQSSWVFSIYNVYNRKNTYFIYTDTEVDLEIPSFVNKAFDVSLFPIIPAVTWNFKL